MAEARLRRGSQADPEPQVGIEDDDDQTDAAGAEEGQNTGDDDTTVENDGSVVVDSETGDEAREAKRQRNREDRMRKKELAKQRDETYRRKIEMLEREKEDLRRRIERVEGHTSSQDVQKVDAAINETQRHIQYWRERIATAASTGDGNALAEAQEKWFEARSRADALSNLKQVAVEQQRAPKQAPLNPMVQEHYANWVKDHSWYNGAGKDQDSRIMLAIDNSLADEGYDPSSSEYWAELTRRGKQQLPHRFKRAAPTPTYDDDEEDDEPMPLANRRRQAPQLSGGSSRESVASSRTEFRLSPDRVRAMKEAGIWDDPKERADMVKRYRDIDRSNRG